MRTEAYVDIEEIRRQQKQQLANQAKATQCKGHLAQQNRARERAARAERHGLEDRNGDLAGMSILSRIAAAVAVVSLPTVYLVDVSIFGASADYFSQLAFPRTEAVRIIARLLMPMLVLTLDLWIGLNVWRAAEQARRDPTARGLHARWIAAAVAFTLLMPLFCAAAAFAEVMSAPEGNIRNVLVGEGLAASLFALIAHAGILLGAHLIERGIAYFIYTSKIRALKTEEWMFGQSAALAENECVQLFEAYWKAHEDFNHEFDLEERPWPFDQFTATLVNERMGRKMVDDVGGVRVHA